MGASWGCVGVVFGKVVPTYVTPFGYRSVDTFTFRPIYIFSTLDLSFTSPLLSFVFDLLQIISL